jgi:hypothetical protein
LEYGSTPSSLAAKLNRGAEEYVQQSVRLRNALDDPVQAKSSELIGHLAAA